GVYGSTLTMQNPLTVSSNVTVGQLGVITQTGGSTTTELYKSSITANVMTISGMIYVTGAGYSASFGPGYNPSGYGSSYGGEGGAASVSAGSTYGSYSAPINLGSGSGGGFGANGGGAV